MDELGNLLDNKISDDNKRSLELALGNNQAYDIYNLILSVVVLIIAIGIFGGFQIQLVGIVVLIIALASIYEMYKCIAKLIIKRKRKALIKDDYKLSTITGKPSRVKIYGRRHIDYRIDLIVLSIEGKKLVICPLRPIIVTNSVRLALPSRIKERSVTLTYLENSQVVDLTNTETAKIIDNILI